MRVIRRALLAAFFATSVLGQASSPKPPAKKSKSKAECHSEPHRALAADDLFDEIIEFPEGPFKGCQADTSSERSIVAVDDGQARQILGADYAKLTPTTRVFANFRASGFWVAALDTAKVDRLIFQTESFQKLSDGEIPAAHSQVRLVMKEDSCVQLYSQQRSSLGEKGPCVKNFLYTVEAMNTLKATVSFDLIKGVQNNFMLAYKMVRLADKLVYMISEAKHDVAQIHLKLNDEEVRKVSDGFVSQALNPKRRLMYHTLAGSCTTELYRVFDDVVVSERAPLRRILFGHLKSLPILPNSYLGARGLVGERLPNAEVEFGKDAKSLSAIP